MNYERTREQILKKFGIVNSPSKIWKSSGQEQRTLSQLTSEKEALYIDQLNTSHDTNLEYSRAVEEFFEFFEKFKENLALVIDGSAPTTHPHTLKAQELEQPSLKDLTKYSDLTTKERNKLEMYYTDFFQLTKSLNTQLQGLQEKFDSAQKSIYSLEGQITTVVYKAQKEKEGYEQRLQELLDTCHNYSEQIERLKTLNTEKLEKKSFVRSSFEIEKNSSYYIEVINQLESQVHELTKDVVNRDRRIEKLTETLQKFEDCQIEARSGKERFEDEVFELEHRVRELTRLVEVKNNDLAQTLDSLRFLQEELAAYKYKDSRNGEDKDLKAQYSLMKKELSECKAKANECKEEMLEYKNQCIEYKKKEKLGKSGASGEDTQILAKLADMIHKICEEYTESKTMNKSSERFSEVFKEVAFISELLEKMTYDNNWLVDKMEELGQENHLLKEEMSQSRVLGDSFSNFHLKSPKYKDSSDVKSIFNMSD